MRVPLQIRPGVAAVVRNAEGQILLHRRRVGGGWAPPSGAVEPGEDLLSALRRELIEETGLEVSVERPVAIYSDPSYQVVQYPNGPRVHFVTTLFACRAIGGPVVGSEEGLEWSWFDAEDLPEDLLPYATVWLGDALAPSGEVLVR